MTRVQLSLMLHHGEQVPNHLLPWSSHDGLVSIPTSLNGCCGVRSEVDLGREADGSVNLGGLGGGGRVFESLVGSNELKRNEDQDGKRDGEDRSKSAEVREENHDKP